MSHAHRLLGGNGMSERSLLVNTKCPEMFSQPEQEHDHFDAFAAFRDGKEPAIAKKAGEKPHSPDRQPDILTTDGCRMWAHNGRITCIKDATGEIYKLSYDSQGQLAKMTEPDGSVLTRNEDGKSWTRLNAKGESHTFNGAVQIGKDGAVKYLGSGGQETICNGDGSTVHRETVDGRKLITRVLDPKGRATEFSYDAEGKPFSIKNPDGSWFVKGTDDNWYKSIPGSGEDQAVPYKIERDETGNVLIKRPGHVTTYGIKGVRQKKA
jgi:YD repeat-containing protein